MSTNPITVLKLSLRTAVLICSLASLVLYLFSIPLGTLLFFSEKLSTTNSPMTPISVIGGLELPLGVAFLSLQLLYILCFAVAWKKREGFQMAVRKFPSESAILRPGNFLVAMPALASLTYLIVIGMYRLQEPFQIPTGKPPLPEDLLLSYFALSYSPIAEEIVFRILPIGVFYAFYLFALEKRRGHAVSKKEGLKSLLAACIYPVSVRRRTSSESVDSSSFWRALNRDEWTILISTSALFAMSHFPYSGTWGIGKSTQAFVQGLFFGLSYIIYGIQAPILMHWFFNYYQYTYSVAAAFRPDLLYLSPLTERLALALGALSLISIAFTGVLGLAKGHSICPRDFPGAVRKMRRGLPPTASRISVYLSRLRLTLSKASTYDLAMLTLVLVTSLLRLVIVNIPSPGVTDSSPTLGLVYDETYYVGAARKMLRGEASNNEHPPLVKALIALGILSLGDTPLGWRIFSIVTSSASLVLLYTLALLLSGQKDVSFFASFLFAVDVTCFNIGQIAMLDGPAMTFVLAASVCLLKGRFDLGGMFLGLASLCKLSVVFVAAGLVPFLLVAEAFQHKKTVMACLRSTATSLLRTFLVGLVVFLLGLWLYDSSYGIFGNPLKHFAYMFTYHSSATYTNPSEVALPLQWTSPLDHFQPIPLYVISVREVLEVGVVRNYHPIAYYEIFTPLWWSLWAILPVSFIETARMARKGRGLGTELFVLSWTLSSFLPFVILAYLAMRWVYPFYFCATLPGLYVGLSYYVARARCSRWLMASLALVQLAWLFIWFPVKPREVSDFLFSLGLPAFMDRLGLPCPA